MASDPQPLARRLRSPRPFPHEWLVLAYLVAAVWALERMPVTYPRMALFVAYAQPVFLIVAVAVVAAALKRWSRPDPTDGLADTAWAIGRLSLLLIPAWASHFLLKSFLFLLNPRTWDLELAALDQRLHLGFNPSVFLTTLLGVPAVLRGLDLVYSGIYYFILVGYTGILLGILRLPLKLAFGAAFMLMWVGGILLYLAIPSWGPVFVFSDVFERPLQDMPITVSVQRVLFEEISSLVRNPHAPRYVRFGSVAAFPSLHVAVVTLCALASREVSKRWFQLNLLLVAVTVVGSVVTGYHYLLDAWAGALLAALSWVACKRYFARAGVARARVDGASAAGGPPAGGTISPVTGGAPRGSNRE